MKDFFKPEDFDCMTVNSNNFTKKAAEFANEKLNKLIESWPSVFSGESYNDKWIDCETMHTTKTAKLAFIEEIKKEECEHSPEWTNKIPGWHHGPESQIKCVHCGVPLQASWSVKNDKQDI
jgi:hypothetical protein